MDPLSFDPYLIGESGEGPEVGFMKDERQIPCFVLVKIKFLIFRPLVTTLGERGPYGRFAFPVLVMDRDVHVNNVIKTLKPGPRAPADDLNVWRIRRVRRTVGWFLKTSADKSHAAYHQTGQNYRRCSHRIHPVPGRKWLTIKTYS